MLRKNLLNDIQIGLRRFYPIWLARNWRGVLRQQARPVPLSETQQEALEALRRDGVVRIELNAEDYASDFKELHNYTKDTLKFAFQGSRKTFFAHLWKDNEVLPTHPYVKFALGFWPIANAYLGSYSKLYACRGFLAHVMPKGTFPTFSQLWHRDHEDRRVLKVFLYMNDVGNSTGPFWYLKGSHRGGQYGKLFPLKFLPPLTPRMTDAEFIPKVSGDDLLKFTGSKYTLILADTMGLHKGGYCTEKSRIMLMAGFCTRGRYKDIFQYYQPVEGGHYAMDKTDL